MTITVNIPNHVYDIRIEKGILKSIGKECNLNRRVLIVTDSGVPIEYAKTVAAQCKEAVIEVIEAGEKSKSLETFGVLQARMLENHFSRKDCVVAVGGGVVGDLSGFAASCYMRGIDFYNVPTTVLSQVDSSIGGKTAVNFNGVKNIVGTFYQPKKVIIDTEVLNSLSPRQISNGLSEAIKMFLTFDAEMFEKIEKLEDTSDITPIIARALEIKKHVVEEDEKESGLRKVLNFGHTLGHGIEVASGGQLLHGESVSIGMTVMCTDEIRDRLIRVLQKYNLPVSFDFDHEAALEAVTHDKKADSGKVSAIFVSEVGKYEMRDMTIEEAKTRLDMIGVK